MAKYKDEGSANEAMRPISPPDPDVARSVEGAASDYAKRMAELRKEAAARKAERDAAIKTRLAQPRPGMKKGGKVKKYASGGSVGSASKRADGCATKGKTKGKFV